MLKKLSFFFFLFSFGLSFSQIEIAFLKEEAVVYTKETIKNAVFEKTNTVVNRGLDKGVYWFRISNLPEEKKIIQITNNRIRNVVAYQADEVLPLLKNERFITLEVQKKETVYLRFNITREALIPIVIKDYKQFLKDEKVNFLFLGFYYGFALVVVLINFFYYVNFKDVTFLYYLLFIGSLCFGLSISDGLYNFFNYSERTIAIVEILDRFLVAPFAILFTSSYLQVENYYPKYKRNMFVLVLLVLFFGIVFVFSENHIWYVIMELFVFTVLTCCWILSFILFSKNLFTKIYVIAYFFILPLGVSYYITKLVGIPIIISADSLKLGAFFEMIVLSFAVVYRMKILQEENVEMRKEIVLYAKKIENLSDELQKNNTIKLSNSPIADLTIREQEIFNFIVKGMSNKEIGEKLNISVNTVKYHVKKIYDKLNVKSRREVKNVML